MLQQVEKRENWASRFGLLMSLAGMAIGLGKSGDFPIWLATGAAVPLCWHTWCA